MMLAVCGHSAMDWDTADDSCPNRCRRPSPQAPPGMSFGRPVGGGTRARLRPPATAPTLRAPHPSTARLPRRDSAAGPLAPRAAANRPSESVGRREQADISVSKRQSRLQPRIGIATTVTVYRELLDEGVDVWRPIEADRENDGSYGSPTMRPKAKLGRSHLEPESDVSAAISACCGRLGRLSRLRFRLQAQARGQRAGLRARRPVRLAQRVRRRHGARPAGPRGGGRLGRVRPGRSDFTAVCLG